MNKHQVTAYYKALCEDLGLTPLPVKFERVGKGGACVTFNVKTKKALSMSLDMNRLLDPEYAVIHEVAHQYLLEKSGDPALRHNAKFRKIECKFMEKYMYSKFSNLLFN